MQRVVLRLVLHAAALASAVGCLGPLSRPMIERLDEKEQAAVDQSWKNLLADPAGVDHTLLLDVLLASGLYQYGIDRVQFRSEKDLAEGLVQMEVSFDRSLPANDRFAVSFISADGKNRWTEQYTREEVDERTEYLAGAHECTPEEAQAEPELCRRWERDSIERKKRVDRIKELLAPLIELSDKPRDGAPGQEPPPS